MPFSPSCRVIFAVPLPAYPQRLTRPYFADGSRTARRTPLANITAWVTQARLREPVVLQNALPPGLALAAPCALPLPANPSPLQTVVRKKARGDRVAAARRWQLFGWRDRLRLYPRPF